MKNTIKLISFVIPDRQNKNPLSRNGIFFICILLLIICLPQIITVSERGFYCDDYYFLSRAKHGNLTDAFKDNLHVFKGLRPIGYFLTAIQYHWFKENALAHQLLMLFLFYINSILLFFFYGKLFEDKYLGLISSALFSVIPWYSQAVFWVLNSIVMLSLLLTVLSGLFFIRHICDATKDKKNLIVSLVFYLIAMLLYEQNVSWIIVWPLLAWALDGQRGWIQALRHSWRHMITAALVALYIVTFSATGDRQSQPVMNFMHIMPWFYELLRRTLKYHIYLTIAGVRSFHLPVLEEWMSSSSWKIILLVMSCVIACYLSIVTIDGAENKIGNTFSFWRFSLVGIVMFLAPIGIMTLSPHPVIENRHQLLASVGLVLFVICILQAVLPWIKKRKITNTGVTILIAMCLIVGGTVTATRSQEWVESWQIQKNIQLSLLKLLPDPPKGAIIIFDDFPARIGFAAFTYGNEWGLMRMVSYIYDRQDVHGYRYLWQDENGRNFAGPRGGMPSEAAEDKPLFFFKYIPEQNKLVTETKQSYKQRHPDRI